MSMTYMHNCLQEGRVPPRPVQGVRTILQWLEELQEILNDWDSVDDWGSVDASDSEYPDASGEWL